ncbi:hypothetical protein HPB50_024618 [Hyalomma asiaticum]|uniref:Uncharacterized protein n=1 Tax=Hyalomma asiaticum TaxID=266040 RepID=A0ACB7SHP1_HYAAI|nr:hypothetical protein HPB50_024618 [Hyalomma asiaticum]
MLSKTSAADKGRRCRVSDTASGGSLSIAAYRHYLASVDLASWPDSLTHVAREAHTTPYLVADALDPREFGSCGIDYTELATGCVRAVCPHGDCRHLCFGAIVGRVISCTRAGVEAFLSVGRSPPARGSGHLDSFALVERTVVCLSGVIVWSANDPLVYFDRLPRLDERLRRDNRDQPPCCSVDPVSTATGGGCGFLSRLIGLVVCMRSESLTSSWRPLSRAPLKGVFLALAVRVSAFDRVVAFVASLASFFFLSSRLLFLAVKSPASYLFLTA